MGGPRQVGGAGPPLVCESMKETRDELCLCGPVTVAAAGESAH